MHHSPQYPAPLCCCLSHPPSHAPSSASSSLPRRFIALADAIEAAFPNVVVEGNPEGPGRPGSFEVKGAANQLLFSRLDSGAWPQHAALVEALAAAAACSTSGEAAQQQA